MTEAEQDFAVLQRVISDLKARLEDAEARLDALEWKGPDRRRDAHRRY